jgi:hypothetical protein
VPAAGAMASNTKTPGRLTPGCVASAATPGGRGEAHAERALGDGREVGQARDVRVERHGLAGRGRGQLDEQLVGVGPAGDGQRLGRGVGRVEVLTVRPVGVAVPGRRVIVFASQQRERAAQPQEPGHREASAPPRQARSSVSSKKVPADAHHRQVDRGALGVERHRVEARSLGGREGLEQLGEGGLTGRVELQSLGLQALGLGQRVLIGGAVQRGEASPERGQLGALLASEPVGGSAGQGLVGARARGLALAMIEDGERHREAEREPTPGCPRPPWPRGSRRTARAPAPIDARRRGPRARTPEPRPPAEPREASRFGARSTTARAPRERRSRVRRPTPPAARARPRPALAPRPAPVDVPARARTGGARRRRRPPRPARGPRWWPPARRAHAAATAGSPPAPGRARPPGTPHETSARPRTTTPRRPGRARVAARPPRLAAGRTDHPRRAAPRVPATVSCSVVPPRARWCSSTSEGLGRTLAARTSAAPARRCAAATAASGPSAHRRCTAARSSSGVALDASGTSDVSSTRTRKNRWTIGFSVEHVGGEASASIVRPQ